MRGFIVQEMVITLSEHTHVVSKVFYLDIMLSYLIHSKDADESFKEIYG